MKIGTLEIEMVVNGKVGKEAEKELKKIEAEEKKFRKEQERLRKKEERERAEFHTAITAQVTRFGKHGLDVVSKHNKEFKELHDTFGDIGIGVGLAIDAVTELTTGKGKLGLLDMIRNTRVLGHSIATWTEFGTLKAIDLLDDMKARAELAANSFGIVFKALKGDVTGAAIEAAKKGNEFAKTTAARRLTAEETQKQLDKILADDPEPPKVAEVHKAVEKEKRATERALNSFMQIDRNQLAGFLAFSRAGGAAGRSAGAGSAGAARAGGAIVGGMIAGEIGSGSFSEGAGTAAAREALDRRGAAFGGTDLARQLISERAPGRFGSRNKAMEVREILSDAGGPVSGPFGARGAVIGGTDDKHNAEMNRTLQEVNRTLQKLDASIRVGKLNADLAPRAG